MPISDADVRAVVLDADAATGRLSLGLKPSYLAAAGAETLTLGDESSDGLGAAVDGDLDEEMVEAMAAESSPGADESSSDESAGGGQEEAGKGSELQ